MPEGVGGTAVRVLRADAVAAWTETVPDHVIPPALERIRAHDAVTAAALATGVTPLPVRFGQTFDSDDACREALRAQASRLTSDLERVQGLVEMRVVVALTVHPAPEAIVDAATPGRAYMQGLMRSRNMEQIVQAAATTVREQISATVRPFVRDEAFVVAASPSPILTLSHLIARGDVPGYRGALDDFEPGAGVKRLVTCGPLAPWQFVSAPA